MKKIVLFLIVFFCLKFTIGQSNRWQQHVNYTINVDVDTATNSFNGTEKLVYQNNSNEKLDKVFYHLYWNAFQPNSSMDARSRELGKNTINGRQDWDGRVKDRISKLKVNEIGYQKIKSLKMNGVAQPFVYHETILEVNLTKAILPNTSVVFEMEFEAQVPLQVRRSGRDNPQTGVRYSMSQWYPKICEFDEEGWHPTPYVAREFYGVWGDFDVTIKIDKSYKLGGTGTLVNANEIGWGYDIPNSLLKPCATSKRTWHFKGLNIHDFVWAADPDYKHIVRNVKNGPVFHVLFNYPVEDLKKDSNWTSVADAAVKVLPFIEKNFGKYPYPQYSFIQGGDGGMEYPMATLISGPSLGTVFHEWMHSWYQMMLGTNESLYSWMDEGFTTYAEDLVSAFYNQKKPIEEYTDALKKNPANENLKKLIQSLPEEHSGSYDSYFALIKSKMDEPMCTHADHYNSNFAYSINSYSKGEVFLAQLGYIVGEKTRDSILLNYYKQWRFKHPNANDFFRVAEKTSKIQLDWYKEFWIHSTKTIDYSIDSVWSENEFTNIRLKRIGQMPMPIDLEITFTNQEKELHAIPLNLMFGNKQLDANDFKEEEWRWTHPTYLLKIKRNISEIKTIEIDPSKLMADVDRSNNVVLLNQ